MFNSSQKRKKFFEKTQSVSSAPLTYDIQKSTTNVVANLTIKIVLITAIHEVTAEAFKRIPIPSIPNDTKSTIANTKKRIKDSQLLVTKAGKGNALIV